MTLPSFIVIGPGRTGTTLVYEHFRSHPQIGMAHHVKETNFYNDNYDKGIDWYQRFFVGLEGKKAIGEISNLYFFDPLVPERIHQTNPGVRLISILRNPYERLISAYRFRKRTGQIPSTMDLNLALDHYPDLITDNYYDVHLWQYFSVFPREQILVLFYDELRQDPETFFHRLYAFIHVDLVSLSLPRSRVNPSGKIRWAPLAKWIRSGADLLREKEWFTLLDTLKRNHLLQKMLYRQNPVESVVLDPLVLERFRAKFDASIAQVEVMLSTDLSHWKSHRLVTMRKP